MARPLTKEQRRSLDKFIRDNAAMPVYQIAEKTGVAKSTVRRAFKDMGLSRSELPTAERKKPVVTPRRKRPPSGAEWAFNHGARWEREEYLAVANFDLTAAEVAEKLGRTTASVMHSRSKLWHHLAPYEAQ